MTDKQYRKLAEKMAEIAYPSSTRTHSHNWRYLAKRYLDFLKSELPKLKCSYCEHGICETC